MIRRGLLPNGVDATVLPLLIGKSLRAFADGYVAVLLPAYLLALGFGTWEVGVLATATLLGSALATLAVGAWGHRFHHRSLLLGAALLMAATGFAFATGSAFWPLLAIAFVGTLNPSSGDVSLFLSLEHARLAEAAHDEARTALFARYSLLGALFAALGALAVAFPEYLVALSGMTRLDALRLMFVLYGLIGCAVWLLYRRLPEPTAEKKTAPMPLGISRGIVVRLAALFSVDSFAGGLVVNSLLALWLFQRFDMSLAGAGTFFLTSPQKTENKARLGVVPLATPRRYCAVLSSLAVKQSAGKKHSPAAGGRHTQVRKAPTPYAPSQSFFRARP